MQELRTIITIDEEKCDGCGLCVAACHEGALSLVDGKAKLMHEHYCDGLGDCLPACPTGAITFEKRMAQAYDEEAVLQAQQKQAETKIPLVSVHGCPSAAAAQMNGASELRQWPVQIKLVSPSAPYFQGADVLIAADCAAFAYATFHRDFMAGRITLIGCPKLDGVDYAEKLTQIMVASDIASVTVARMSVPCCGGIECAAKEAVAASGKNIPITISVISTDGNLQA